MTNTMTAAAEMSALATAYRARVNAERMVAAAAGDRAEAVMFAIIAAVVLIGIVCALCGVGV